MKRIFIAIVIVIILSGMVFAKGGDKNDKVDHIVKMFEERLNWAENDLNWIEEDLKKTKDDEGKLILNELFDAYTKMKNESKKGLKLIKNGDIDEAIEMSKSMHVQSREVELLHKKNEKHHFQNRINELLENADDEQKSQINDISNKMDSLFEKMISIEEKQMELSKEKDMAESDLHNLRKQLEIFSLELKIDQLKNEK